MATVYLDPAGNDTRTYAQAQNPATPWATLAKVEASATTGDTVSMAAGTYASETITWSKNFTIVGAPLVNGLPTTIIDDASNGRRWTLSGRTFTISQVWFDNLAHSNGLFYFASGGGGLAVTNCYFNIVGGGLITICECASVTVSPTFTACIFYVNTSNSIVLFRLYSPAAASVVSLFNCVIYLVQFATSHGIIYLYTANAGFTVKNCILYNATGGSRKFTLDVTGAPTPTIEYNCFYGTWTFDVGSSVNGITSDPLFVDVANLNFRLRPDSPCIDAGTVL